MIGFFKCKSIAFTVIALALLAGILGTVGVRNVAYAAGMQAGKSFTFRTLNDHADPTFNQLLGINNSGVLAGYFGSGEHGHPNRGYTLKPSYGQRDYTDENFPGSVQTRVTGIDNIGNTCGFYVDRNGNTFGFVEWNGVFTSVRDPDTGQGRVNGLLGINDQGIAVGIYQDGNGITHAYKFNRNTGRFTSIVPPHGTQPFATGINNNGDVVGFLMGFSGPIIGFLLKGKTFTEFDFPRSNNTEAFGVNDFDQVVGNFFDGNGNIHGFLLSNPLKHARWQSIDDPNGVGWTTVTGINDKADLVGYYVDSSRNINGFLATPS